jgi:hypothetical protein
MTGGSSQSVAARSRRGMADKGLELMATGTAKWFNADKDGYSRGCVEVQGYYC